MKRLTNYINRLVNIEIKHDSGNKCTLSGYITAVGKEHFLIIDQDKKEHSFKKANVNSIKSIVKHKKQLSTHVCL